jgi:hypothetical protein
MTKIILFTQFVLFSVAFSFAQHSVEITVQDTVYQKVTGINYLLGLDIDKVDLDPFSSSDYLDEFDFESEEEEEEPKKKTLTDEEIKALLIKGKFTFETKSTSNYELGEEGEQVYLLKLKNEEEVRRLFELFKGKEEVEGKITELEFEPISNHNEELYKKLYTKALNEAKIIAGISGQSVGALVKVSENKGEMDRYMQIYEQVLSRMPFGDKKIIDLKGKETVIQRVYTFEIK